MQFLRSLAFALWGILSVVVYGTPVMFAGLAPNSQRFVSAMARRWARMLLWGLRWMCGLSYVVEGRENIPSRASVVMIKHQSALETIVQILEFPDQTWVLKRGLLWVPLFGQAVAAFKPIAIDRSAGMTALEQVCEQGKQRLAEGIWVMIFPEGTRVGFGQAGRYRSGGAMLACQAGVDIVPVAHDCGRLWPRRSFVKHRGVARFVIGPPISTVGKRPGQALAECRDWIEGKVEELQYNQ